MYDTIEDDEDQDEGIRESLKTCMRRISLFEGICVCVCALLCQQLYLVTILKNKKTRISHQRHVSA